MQSLSINGFCGSLERQFPVRLILTFDDNRIQLELIEIDEEFRNLGYGTEVLNNLIDYSEAYNIPIELTPSGDFSPGNVIKRRYNLHRLRKFYKKHGFIQQRGPRKYDMIRHCN